MIHDGDEQHQGEKVGWWARFRAGMKSQGVIVQTPAIILLLNYPDLPVCEQFLNTA
jgi:hypothetical protein